MSFLNITTSCCICRGGRLVVKALPNPKVGGHLSVMYEVLHGEKPVPRRGIRSWPFVAKI